MALLSKLKRLAGKHGLIEPAKNIVCRLVSPAIKPFGYSLIKESDKSLGETADQLAEHLHELFRRLAIDSVIDVGANRGQYYDFLRDRVGFNGRIISFEPIPDLAEKLLHRSKNDPNWTVMDYALGKAEATLPLQVMTRAGWSSLLKKRADSGTEMADTFEVEKVLDVKVRTLDDVLSSESLGNVYLKIDAQGTDLDVLRGGHNTARNCLALQTELEFINVYESSSDFQDVLSFLTSLGFSITGLFPIWSDQTMRIGEADAVFLNMAHNHTI